MPGNKAQEQRYWEAQIKVIQALRVIGINYNLDDRIPPFEVLVQIRRKAREEGILPPQLGAYNQAVEAISTLVKGRQVGAEPEHHSGKYTKEKVDE